MMKSTFPQIVNLTPAVLAMMGTTADEYRVGTLKRCDCELANLLDDGVADLHDEHRAALRDLLQQVRLSLTA